MTSAAQHTRPVRVAAIALLLAGAVALLGVSSAAAVTEGTGWHAFSSVAPTNLAPGGDGTIQVAIMNTGAKPSDGPITVIDTLPAGVIATKAGGMQGGASSAETKILTPAEEEAHEGVGVLPHSARWVCMGNGSGERGIDGASTITCRSNPADLPSVPSGAGNSTLALERIGIAVRVEGSAVSGTFSNGVEVGGGGALGATSVSDPVTVGSWSPGFGFEDWDVWFSNADGTIDTQAGSHPYTASFAFTLNQVNGEQDDSFAKLAGGEARTLESVLPPGFFGDPGAVPQCTRAQLDGEECPAASQIGVDEVGFEDGEPGAGSTTTFIREPVFSIVPPPGVPDEFAFSVAGFHAIFNAGVRSGNGYGIVEHIENIPPVNFGQNILTIWGVPAEASHNPERKTQNPFICEREGCPGDSIAQPFLTLPTSCAGPQTFSIRGLSTWEQRELTPVEASAVTRDNTGAPVGFTGCEHLTIEPSISAIPETGFADTPAGLGVEVKVPQENLLNPEGLVASTLKNTSVTLPEGLVINPGQAAGLQSCGETEANIHGEGPQSCPSASKVGTVKIRTPLLEGALESELEGDVYVLQSNPPELRLLIAASGDGVYLKLPATVHLNEATGQLTTTVEETPALPFTSFKLVFSGGAQAALATPVQCGTYTTDADFTPWTTPFGVDVPFSNSFPISSGPNGSGCVPSPLPFSPSLTAGSTTDQAGGFTSFSLLLTRGDGQQRIERLQFKIPQGLSGMISQVSLCPESQAARGECSEASKVGHAAVASGPGPYPLVIPQPGNPESQIYLTGPYKGAPFGLSIVTHVIAGPFNLGTIVTRAKIEVDPTTAQITVTTDPLPQIVAGVPTDLRLVDAVIDRPGFMFNPTNCNPGSFSGTAWGTPPPGVGGPGASAPIASHFQVGSCRSLEFKPGFKVTTSAKTSRANGASLHVALTYPQGSFGKDANIAKVKVDLPKQLPSRLTTLQKACTEQVFAANPASCPSASIVGHARAITPLLPVPLEGPAYFVSHGGAKFPELVIVLQGYGVTLDLHGETFINKAGITSSTFATVPDAPVGTFELTLPQGKYSALAANGNLCKSKLIMPTAFTAQNGAVIHENTPIGVTGCPKHVRHERKKKTAKKRRK